MSRGNWIEVSASSPCQVCSKPGWCSVTADGTVLKCNRHGVHPTLGAGKSCIGKAGPYWTWFDGERSGAATPTRSHTEGATDRATPDELNQMYRALFKVLFKDTPKAPDEFFDRRGVPADSKLREWYRTWPGRGRSKIAGKLVGAGYESLMARTPGFVVKDGERGGTYWTLSGCAGIAIPVLDALSRIVGVSLRPEKIEGDAKYLWLTSKNQGGAKARPVPHVPVFVDGNGKRKDCATVRLTEGVVKADVATQLGGLLCVGLPGLGCDLIRATLRWLKVEVVRLAFDGDVWCNPHVAVAVAGHFKRLSRAGFDVQLETWDVKDGKGIDDLLANGKTPELIVGAHVADAIEAMVAAAEKATASAAEAKLTAEVGSRVPVSVGTHEAEIVRKVVAVLAARDDNLYQRDGALVEVIKTTMPPRIVRLSTANIRNRLTDYVVLMGVDKRAKGENVGVESPIEPPPWLAPAIRDLNVWPGIRNLVAVTDAPVLRPDGTVHQCGGFDRITSVLQLFDATDFPPIPENPTQDDARAAAEVLLSGVAEFPWRADSDKAAWLAEVLTFCARNAFPGPSPAFYHDANQPSTGKTRTAEAAFWIATGRPLPLDAYPVAGRKRDQEEDAAEIRKLATAASMEGHLAFLLDNVPTGWQFGSGTLDAVITSTANAGRQLHTSSTPTRDAFTVWLLTGNNITPRSDTVRRSVRVGLYDDQPPGQRTYSGLEVVEWAKRNRGRLYVAALTIVAAYIRAERPEVGLKPFQSFEGWSGLVRSAVVWIGQPDPVGDREALAAEDPDLEVAAGLIRLLRRASPGGLAITAGVVVKQITEEMKTADPDADLDDAEKFPLTSTYRTLFPRAKPDPQLLGTAMREHKGRIVDGERIEHKGRDRNKVALWSVAKVRSACGPSIPRTGADTR